MVFGCTAYLLVFSLAPGLYSQYQNSLAISKHERIIKMPLISFSRGQQNLIKVFTRNNLLINLCSQNMFPLENWLHYEFFLSNSVEPEKGLPSPSGPFILQPLFQKVVEKWFEKSGSRKVVDQKKRWFYTINPHFFRLEKSG